MEESGSSEGADKQAPCWIVDPLDGTTNFLHGIPHFAISIAVMEQGKIIAGAIFDPVRDEFFHAEQGIGAYLNGRRYPPGQAAHGRSAVCHRYSLYGAR